MQAATAGFPLCTTAVTKLGAAITDHMITAICSLHQMTAIRATLPLVRPIHVFCFVITTIDKHVFGIHPCEEDALIDGHQTSIIK